MSRHILIDRHRKRKGVNPLTVLKFIFVFINLTLIFPQKPNTLEELKKRTIQAQKKVEQEGEREIKQAQTLEQSGMVEDAERIYRDLLQKNSRNGRAFSRLKSLLRNQQRFDDFVLVAEIYAENRPNDPHANIDLMEAYIWVDNNMWSDVADKIIGTYQNNLPVMKTFIGRVIANGFLDDALQYVEQFRSGQKKPDFYAMELGTYFRTRMAFDRSLENYLLYLKHNPKKYQSVSNWLMAYPDEVSIQLKLKNILKNSNVIGAQLLLADMEFKSGNFDGAYVLIKTHYKNPSQLLQFAQQLSKANAYDVALRVYSDIINGQFKAEIIRSAIYGMATVLESQSVKAEAVLPISGFFNGNEFFESPYYSVDEVLMPSLWKAVGIYDSLRTDAQSSDAAFRLAEIRFKAMNDLDGAFKLYEEVAHKSRKRPIRFLATLAMVDIQLAKGDLDMAKAQIKRFFKTFKTKEETQILRVKECQINFYNGELNAVKDSLALVLKKLPKDAPRYNDLLDVQSVILAFMDHPKLFADFAKVQLLIRQNKRVQALEKLTVLISTTEPFVAHIAAYQVGYIHLLREEYLLSLDVLKTIKGETIFYELGQIMQAEILDYIQNDPGAAIDIYLQFLESYPLSIYYDDIRLRLRKLASLN